MSANGAIELQMDTPYGWHRNPNLVFTEPDAFAATFCRSLGESLPASGEQLEAGIAVPVPISSAGRANR